MYYFALTHIGDFVHVDSYGELASILNEMSSVHGKRRGPYRTILLDADDPSNYSGWSKTYMVVGEKSGDTLPLGYCNFDIADVPRFSFYGGALVLAAIVSVLTSVHSVCIAHYDTAAWCAVTIILYYVIWILRKTSVRQKLSHLIRTAGHRRD